MAYTGFIVEINKLRKHSNADRLQIATVFGNDVVVGLDVKKGDEMIYFPTDGQLSKEYASVNNLVRVKDASGKNVGGYLDPNKRNIRAIKLRGERSDGMLMPIESLYALVGEEYVKNNLDVGDSIDVLDGVLICSKYVPENKSEKSAPFTNSKKKKENKFFPKHIDTAQLAYSINEIKEGDELTITLKMHGTSARIGYVPDDNQGEGFLSKLFSKLGLEKKKKWKMFSGSRRIILEDFDGWSYGSNEFRKKYHELFDGRLKKGEVIYGEIVGYMNNETPIMPRVQNKKLGDKEFTNKYGELTTFDYGCEEGESDFYAYRMTMTNEEGDIVEYPTWLTQLRCEQMGVKHVPVIDKIYVESGSSIAKNKDLLLDVINKHAEGTDPVGLTHIKEGVVVRIENREKFTALKHKSFEFKVLEGIIKEEALEPDMEESK